MSRIAPVLVVLASIPTVLAGEAAAQLKLLGPLPGARPPDRSNVAFSPDGKLLASSDTVVNSDGESISTIKIWDVQQRKLLAALEPGRAPSDRGTFWVGFSPDGKTLAVLGEELTLWDVARREKLPPLKVRGPVVFSPDWRMFATAEDRTVRVWETASQKQRAAFTVTDGFMLSLAFSPDGRTLSCGTGKSASNGQPSGGAVTLWDLTTGQERATLRGVFKLRLTPKVLAGLRLDGVPQTILKKLVAWQAKEFPTEDAFDEEFSRFLNTALTAQQRKKYQDILRREIVPVPEGQMIWVWSQAFSPDGKTLACADVYGNVLLWNVQSGKRTATLQAFNPQGREEDINPALAVCFNPDGSLVAAATVRGLKFWDAKTYKEIKGLKSPPASSWAVAFSPDGRTLATAGSTTVVGIRDNLDDAPVVRLWEVIRPDPDDRAGRTPDASARSRR
jgi:WD40 repeat protein